MEKEKDIKDDPLISAMFSVGAHYGYSKSRRHPSVKPFIFGQKNKVEIFDLEKIKPTLLKAREFVASLGMAGKQIIFASSKPEALNIVKDGALSIGMPYVAGRWVGGTLTNFSVIRTRVDRMLNLLSQKEKGELAKYTKKERLLIDRDVAKLSSLFSGLIPMKSLPAGVFVIDSIKESTAVAEARKLGISIVALTGSDCDLAEVDYPIVGNDSSKDSITFFVKEIVEAYKEGTKGKISNS